MTPKPNPNPAKKRLCPICRRPFTPRRPHQEFDQPRCRKIAFKMRHGVKLTTENLLEERIGALKEKLERARKRLADLKRKQR